MDAKGEVKDGESEKEKKETSELESSRRRTVRSESGNVENIILETFPSDRQQPLNLPK